MPTDFKPGCVRPKSTLAAAAAPADTAVAVVKEEIHVAKVGGLAPDFELAGYQQGGFKNFRLSEYRGKWVVLCFYPGDFTFV